MSQKQHRKQLDRARTQRRAAAAEAKRKRVRIIAIVLVVAMALSLFAAALFARGDDPATPEVAGTPAADDATGTASGYDEDTSPTSEADDPAAAPDDPAATADPGEASYADPQPATAEPCPTDVEAPEPAATPYDAAPEMAIDEAATHVATIETTCGTIVIALATAEAPATVNNFVALAEDDYYVGVPFHRVINGFMVQGGDPSGTGHGDGGTFPGYTFEDELDHARATVEAEGGYPRGSVAMANAGPDTNGSQFFIVQATPGYPLPPDYTLFGTVLEGMDVVDRIAQGPVQGDQAVDPVRILDVTIEQQPA